MRSLSLYISLVHILVVTLKKKIHISFVLCTSPNVVYVVPFYLIHRRRRQLLSFGPNYFHIAHSVVVHAFSQAKKNLIFFFLNLFSHTETPSQFLPRYNPEFSIKTSAIYAITKYVFSLCIWMVAREKQKKRTKLMKFIKKNFALC